MLMQAEIKSKNYNFVSLSSISVVVCSEVLGREIITVENAYLGKYNNIKNKRK